MATLSDLCATMPTEWVEREQKQERKEAIRLSKNLERKMQRKAHREQLRAYREREARRAMRKGEHGVSLEGSRRMVRRETMPESMRKETTKQMFFYGQGVRSPKKVKNRASSEEMGTIGRRIVVKRFAGSRITCVCKSRIY